MQSPNSTSPNPNDTPVGGRTKSESAFSLIELLSVMAVLTLLATLTVPSMTSIMKGRDLSNATDRAWSAVAAARQQAISQQANVVVVVTNGRSSNPDKTDAFILLAATATESGGIVTWTWKPLSRWSKLPTGIAVAPESASFLTTQGTPTVAAYSSITAALPKLDGDSIADYSYVVFRPDGTVDSASANPVLGFKRLRPTAASDESALVVSPDSGRARVVRL